MSSAPSRPGQANRQQGWAHLSILGYVVFVSTSFPVGAVIASRLDPITLTLLRFAMAALLFGAAAVFTGVLRRPTLGSLLRYTLIGMPMAVFFIAMFEALKWTDPVTTGCLYTLIPLFSAGVAYLLLGHRADWRVLACLALGAFGATWVVFDGRIELLLTLRLGYGEWVFIGGCLASSAYAPLVARLHQGDSILVLTFWSLVMGTVVLAAVQWLLAAPLDLSAIDGVTWAGTSYLAVVSTGITFYLFINASSRLAPTKVMAYTYLTPSFVMLLEGVLGHGWPAAILWPGLAITIVATTLLQSRRLAVS